MFDNKWLHSNYCSFTPQSIDLQVLKLLQKFLDSDVIRDVRGKLTKFDEEGSTLYCFVTEPGPLNFVEDMDTSSCHSSPSRPRSPLGKHMRPMNIMEGREEDSSQQMADDTLFMNAYAFLNDSMNENATETASSKKGGGSKVRLEASDESASGSPVKKCRSDSSIASKLNLHHRSSVGTGDSLSLNGESRSTSHGGGVQLSPAQVAGVWKDLTLNRLLQLVELETLEGVLAYDAVDGKHIASNFGTLTVNRTLASRATSTTKTSSSKSMSLRTHGRGGSGCGHATVGGVSSGVGSTHPHWLNRRFSSKLSRVQPTPSPPPAANVHTSLYRSRSNNKLHPSSMTPSSSMLSLTLHHKLRYSIKHGSSSDRTTTTTAYLPPKSLSSSSPCLAGEGGGRGEFLTVHINQSIAL